MGESMSTGDGVIHLSDVVAAMSYALDITEGQPQGHAARSCLLGMRLAREIGLPSEMHSALFYALLLKDLGCSSNASKVCYLFGADDRAAKCDLKTTDWSNFASTVKYVARNVAPGASALRRAAQFISTAARSGGAARELVEIRCDRGAAIARHLNMPEATALAIRSLDEHWDGGGYPDGLVAEQVPLFSRILGLAQTVEVFWSRQGIDAACEMAVSRSEKWFDPDLVSAFISIRNDASFWEIMNREDAAAQASAFEPKDCMFEADEQALDRIAEGFAMVVDAKSPWTYRHSTRVAEIATGIGSLMGWSPGELKTVRRAGLLHDIGKLGVSNMILDKPGKLTAEELAQMRKHPGHTQQILAQVHGFQDIVELAASHHERLDGRGYHRGRDASSMTAPMRAMVVADMYEALTAKRPYRADMSREQVLAILEKDSGVGICSACLDALKALPERSEPTTVKAAA
jgi:putative nucleotidyltransferase with HDIG domain